MMELAQKLRVAELFAGVGGFRLGLEKSPFEIIWSNQWEPSTRKQHASEVYVNRFGGNNHVNRDIAEVPVSDIPDHDLLVGGFPCQDYSVANSTRQLKGIVGKKGVLWWSIHKILSEKEQKPKYLLFENVDRLLKSPVSQKGRDFAVMLKSLDELGYAVEWRVINAAEYGMPQRRKRVFFIGYHRETALYKKLEVMSKERWLMAGGIMACAFPVMKESMVDEITLTGDLAKVSEQFNRGGRFSPFTNTGVMLGGKIYTQKTCARYAGHHVMLGDVLLDEIDKPFYIREEDKSRWDYVKGAKSFDRISKSGHSYRYSEGAVTYPDALDRPSRTIITDEGGKCPSRTKHVVNIGSGLRRLTPVELERLNMFPDGHTELEGISGARRAFLMGNALVVGVVEKLGVALHAEIMKDKEPIRIEKARGFRTKITLGQGQKREREWAI